MAAKLLQSLTDENLDLQKQIGCMTGIFQLFDRQQFLTGGRRIVGHTPNRIPAGKSQFSSGAFERDSNNLRSSSSEKYSAKHIQDRQRVFTESSRASFSSSSRSSSFSSIDCNRAAQLEPASYDRIIFPETPSRNPTSLHNSSPQLGRQGVDLRDLVKDSMYREIQGFSVKAKITDEATDPGSKLRDLGRTKPKKPITPTDLKESLRVLAKLQDTTWHHTEPKLMRSSSYHSKEGSSFSISKDAPRFSYDGREVNRAQDGHLSKSSLKLRDLPRLSLDSREGSIQSLKADSKASFFVKAPQEVDRTTHKLLSSGNLARPAGVVAKLMGLETLPDSVSCSDTNVGSSRSFQMEDFDDASRSSVKTDAVKPIQLLSSSPSKSLWKEPSSPRWRNPDPSMKPMSRFPIEPAPWKQTDGTKNSPKPALRSSRGPAKASNAFPTVYSEIEKRLKDLEFTQSGKDLRALKQILEAMQVKGLLETEKEGQGSKLTGNKDLDPNLSNNGKSQSEQILASSKKVSGRNFETPIVIMKPSKLVEKSAASVISTSGLTKLEDGDSVENRHGLCSVKTADNRTVKSSQRENAASSSNLKSERFTRTTQNSTNSQKLTKESHVSSGKSLESTSPRLQQKKVELEKRLKPQTTTSDSSKTRKQANKQQTESISPGGRRRAKNPSSQQSVEQVTEMRMEPRNSSYTKNENSLHIQCSKSAEVYSSERSLNLSQRESPSANPPALEDKKLGLNLIEDETSELASAPPEYLSPVSVLDNLVHKDDSHSPVKYTGKTLKVDDIERNIDLVRGMSANNSGSSSVELGFTSEVNRKKLQNIDNLVQKLRRLNSSHDEARTDYIASLCENTDPDHRYISEILLASGFLLRDLGSSLKNFQFHSSGHPINPELFLVLEQTKASTFHKEDQSCARKNKSQMMATDKSGRKLIFDAVNEILGRRLAAASPSSEPWLSTAKQARKPLNAQRLLRDLCSEIEGLQATSSKYNVCDQEEDDGWKNILCEDVMHRLERWTSFDDEISGLVLDIERSIFKELVDEIVAREYSGSKTKSNKPGNHLQSN